MFCSKILSLCLPDYFGHHFNDVYVLFSINLFTELKIKCYPPWPDTPILSSQDTIIEDTVGNSQGSNLNTIPTIEKEEENIRGIHENKITKSKSSSIYCDY